MKSWDIVGYVYQSDIVCPTCTLKALSPEARTAEEALDAWAKRDNIDRDDEWTFDSGDFPKVISADVAERDDRCGTCGRYLIPR